MQFHFAAVRAFKGRREFTFERQAATFAKRRADKADLLPAFYADKASLTFRALASTNLADFGIKKSEAGVKPALDECAKKVHRGIWNGVYLSPIGKNFKMKSVKASTRKASQPSIILPLPQNQIAARGTSAVNAP